MDVDPMTMARARSALRQAIRSYLLDPNATLIDIGLPIHGGQIAEDELAIRIHVQKKLSGFQLEAAVGAGHTRPIPPFIGGFPTDVPEGVYRPGQWNWWDGWWGRRIDSSTGRFDPMHGGISISDENHIAAGTLGCKVVDRSTGEEMILSNWHVLVAEWRVRTGQRIFQPGRLDGGTRADTVATLTRDAMSSNIDAAVATLTGGRRLVNDEFNVGQITSVAQAQLGMEVKKSGRTTGVTFGRVTGVEGVSPPIQYGSVSRMIRNVVVIDARTRLEQVSASGDSGACWVNPTTLEAIALHFAGDEFSQRALGIDMQAVLDALNVNIPAA